MSWCGGHPHGNLPGSPVRDRPLGPGVAQVNLGSYCLVTGEIEGIYSDSWVTREL